MTAAMPATDIMAAVVWLRRCMEVAFADRRAASPQPAVEELPVRRPSRVRRLLTWLGISDRERPVVERPADGAGPGASPDRELAEDWRACLSLSRLGDAFNLTDRERLVLLLAAAPEVDAGFPAFCEELLGQQVLPAFALAEVLFPGSGAFAMSSERPLRRFHLLEIYQPGGTPLLQSEVHASQWAVERLRLGAALDPRLADSATSLVGSQPSLPQSHRAPRVALSAALTRAFDRPTLVQLCGPEGADKAVLTAAAAGDLTFYALSPGVLSLSPSEVDLLAMLWARESFVRPVALFVEAEHVDDRPDSAPAIALRRLINGCSVPVVLATREPWRGLARSGPLIEVSRPSAAEQRAIWTKELGAEEAAAAGDLAAQFNFGAAEIRRVSAESLPPPHGVSVRDHLWGACRALKRPQMEGLAEKVAVTSRWDDVVLPEAERRLIEQLIDQVRYRARVYDEWGLGAGATRGLGITAVFAGESGVGKTFAAEGIAAELGLDLYRIDLSAVVDKYIGETEKNLRRLFDAAEDGGVMLFFDEADALFGKRTEVKESHDRFANIEINYLLQRLESYRGLVVLATNMASAIDQAFLRRIRFLVRFPFPDHAARRQIWERLLPPARVSPELDFDALGRLTVTGGNIRNIAMNALFLAAADRADQVNRSHLQRATADEFRKIGRPWHDDLLDPLPATANGGHV